jgi:hypothetical protein
MLSERMHAVHVPCLISAQNGTEQACKQHFRQQRLQVEVLPATKPAAILDASVLNPKNKSSAPISAEPR